MFETDVFKSNSVFIVPYVIKNVQLFTTNALKSVEIESIGFLKYIRVLYDPISLKQRKWLYYNIEAEKNLYNTTEEVIGDNIYLVARFLIPTKHEADCDIISSCGLDMISKQQLIDFMLYWKENSYKILEQKTRAARESSPGLFFLLIVYTHYLFFIIISFLFRSVPLLI